MQDFLSIENISFSYENCIEPLFESVSLRLHRGWTGIVGPNGSGKTTFLKLVSGLLNSDSGIIDVHGNTCYCEQRTDFMPADLTGFVRLREKSAYRIKDSLQIQDGWVYRWDTLSHGERKRCQLAVALYREPAILAVDEPSNHLDYGSKKILFKALKSYKGIGLLVSHDRELLDNLCRHTLFLFPPDIDMRKCNYSVAFREIEKEKESKLHKYEIAKQKIKKLKRRVGQQSEKAKQVYGLRSKRKINSKDRDAKSKIDLARLTGKDAVEGRIHQRLKSRLDRAEQHKNTIDIQKVYALGIKFDEKKAAKTFPIIIPSCSIPLGKEGKLNVPESVIQYGDKIGIIGDNGSGKSTFIKYFVQTVHIADDQMIYIPQEIPINQSELVIQRIHNYGGDIKGLMMSIIRRLGSDPTHILETTIPSPGEVRKLMLAEGIMLNPGIIIMDEPTNHLDLPSIECIEKALVECSCSQLLVSHDHVFLRNITTQFWSFEKAGEKTYSITNR